MIMRYVRYHYDNFNLLIAWTDFRQCMVDEGKT